MSDYVYAFSRTIPEDALQALFAQTGWAATRTPEAIRTMLDSTRVCLGVWDGDRLIGFARAVTDDRFRAFVEDVVVDEAYRERGIGAEMMRRLLARLAHVAEIALVCDDKMIPFYERLGFERFTMTHMHIRKSN